MSTISTGITQVVGDRVEALGRGGAAIAVSSGLVASFALPAGAVTQQPLDRSPHSASLPLLGADLLSANLAGTSVLGARGGLATGAPLTAPTTATVVFDQGTLTATTRVATRVAAKAARDAATKAAAQRAAAVVTPKAVARTTARAKA
ncbi:MAG: hypothetical protein WAL50_23125, partial [Kineosporiaceae bacterium]